MSSERTPQVLTEFQKAFDNLKDFTELEISPVIFNLPEGDYKSCLSQGLYCSENSGIFQKFMNFSERRRRFQTNPRVYQTNLYF